MSGKAMARMVLKKVNGKNIFFYRQSRYLSYPLKRMLCNTLIQPYYDCACLSCIRYCLGQKDRSHIKKNEYGKINWLPLSNSVDQWLAATGYNFKNALSPKYMGDIYSLRISSNIKTLRSTDSFVVPLYKKEIE